MIAEGSEDEIEEGYAEKERRGTKRAHSYGVLDPDKLGPELPRVETWG
ncbi:hypothetical protein SAMN05216316_0754 [Nitrosovibrio sp. Nv6]|nr:hypothetical protein SAMN05216316_0754 [Nitrosovibrio sp. Nv6]